MNVTVSIPDEFAARFAAGDDVGRRGFEAPALEEFRADRLTKPELRRLLGLETRYALDGFLKAHGVFEAYTLRDLAHDRENLKGLGLWPYAARSRRHRPVAMPVAESFTG